MTLVLFNSGGFRSSKLCTLRCFSVVNVILYTRLYIYIDTVFTCVHAVERHIDPYGTFIDKLNVGTLWVGVSNIIKPIEVVSI